MLNDNDIIYTINPYLFFDYASIWAKRKVVKEEKPHCCSYLLKGKKSFSFLEEGKEEKEKGEKDNLLLFAFHFL